MRVDKQKVIESFKEVSGFWIYQNEPDWRITIELDSSGEARHTVEHLNKDSKVWDHVYSSYYLDRAINWLADEIIRQWQTEHYLGGLKK
jgi:hypothetical protein